MAQQPVLGQGYFVIEAALSHYVDRYIITARTIETVDQP